MQPDVCASAVSFVALQRLSNYRWGITELFPKVRQIKNAHIVFKQRDYPYWQTVGFIGEHTKYQLTLPRMRHIDGKKISVTNVAIAVSNPSGYCEGEFVSFVEKLMRPV